MGSSKTKLVNYKLSGQKHRSGQAFLFLLQDLESQQPHRVTQTSGCCDSHHCPHGVVQCTTYATIHGNPERGEPKGALGSFFFFFFTVCWMNKYTREEPMTWTIFQ